MFKNKMPFHQKYEYIDEALKKSLKHSRYQHSIGVMHTAGCLAMRYSEDVEKAMLAGLIHDCTKNIEINEQIKLCKDNNVILKNEDLANPEIIHSITAPIMARNAFNITDISILNAIRYHTTGKENMNNFEKLIYTADFIEGGRFFTKDPEVLDKARFLAFNTNLDRTVAYILNKVLVWLSLSRNILHSDTLTANEFYLKFLIDD